MVTRVFGFTARAVHSLRHVWERHILCMFSLHLTRRCEASMVAFISIHDMEFTLRRTPDGWDVMGLPHSDMYWSPLEGENRVIGRLQFRDGALYESWGSSNNWIRRPRAYNAWQIWAAKLLKK